MGEAADRAAAALPEVWAQFIARLPAGWERRGDGIYAGVTGVPAPPFNGVWAFGADARADAVAAALADVAATGLPHCLQVRAGLGPSFAELAAGRGMVREEEDTPLMVLEDAVRLRADAVDGLEIRTLSRDEADAHVAIAAPAFGLPPELLAALVPPEVMSADGLRVYVGSAGGEAVATAVALTLEDSVGVFNVATADGHRRRGYGGALTARAVQDAVASGASWAWLQSSTLGYGVYEALGFRTVERWPCWVSPGAPPGPASPF